MGFYKYALLVNHINKKTVQKAYLIKKKFQIVLE